MGIYLGVDGGGTKTKFILCDERGSVLSEATLSTCHYLQCGFPAVSKTLSGGLRAVCAESGIRPQEISYAFVACAGYGDLPSDCRAIEDAVGRAFSAFPFRIGNDCENALAGALCGGVGINLAVGTGSIGAGRNGNGELRRCGGWHYALGGDEGSGYWIALQLIHTFLRQCDGRDKRTILYDTVKEKLGIASPGELLAKIVYEWKLDRARIASLSVLTGDLYDCGDPYAKRILRDAGKELCDIAAALYCDLHFTEIVPVSYTGSVFLLGERILQPLRQSLAEFPMRLLPPVLPPDRGALILAMQADHVSISDDVIHTLSMPARRDDLKR